MATACPCGCGARVGFMQKGAAAGAREVAALAAQVHELGAATVEAADGPSSGVTPSRGASADEIGVPTPPGLLALPIGDIIKVLRANARDPTNEHVHGLLRAYRCGVTGLGGNHGDAHGVVDAVILDHVAGKHANGNDVAIDSRTRGVRLRWGATARQGEQCQPHCTSPHVVDATPSPGGCLGLNGTARRRSCSHWRGLKAARTHRGLRVPSVLRDPPPQQREKD